MKKSTLILFAAIVGFTFNSCDEIENPVLDFGVSYRADLYGPAPTFTPTTEPHQKVLLEDFTGHDCGNCPNGHAVVHTILETDSADVAAVAVHAGSLAAPLPPEYPADWTTPDGQYYLLTQVGVDAMPKGRVNRSPQVNTTSNPSTWVAKVTEALTLTPPVNMQIETNFVDADDVLNIHINSEWFQNLTGTYNLVVMITESDIVAPQLWYGHDPEYIPDYVHEHMLRATVTGATGTVVMTDPAADSQNLNSYTFGWNNNWVPENCEVIAIITEGENGKVLNVQKQKVIQ